MTLRILLAAVLTIAIGPPAVAAQNAVAIVLKDQVSLRAEPRESAASHAVLGQGEMVEVRGERMDFLQVYDYRRERAGFVRADEARRLALTPEEAPALHAIVQFLQSTPGSEALGIGYAAAYIQAAPAATLRSNEGVDILDALGTMADRLARRASNGSARSQAAQTALSGHLETATRHGVTFANFQRNERVQICYDGDAFRRVLAMNSSPEQRARSALALTRLDCAGDDLNPSEQKRVNESRGEILDRADTEKLPGYLKNRVLMRRAAIWSSLAHQRARRGEAPDAAAQRALQALSGINKNELANTDLQIYNLAAMRVNATRWASVPQPINPTKHLHIATVPGQPGETCVLLLNQTNDIERPLAKRCTFAIVWAASATTNREGTALALAVQPTATWRELWVFRKSGTGWVVHVLPPATTMPEIGYAEFAGWVPGGSQILVVREAIGEGKYRRSFEQVSLDSLGVLKQASNPNLLNAFRRWQDPQWKTQTVSLR